MRTYIRCRVPFNISLSQIGFAFFSPAKFRRDAVGAAAGVRRPGCQYPPMSLEMGGGCAAGGVRVRYRRSDGEFSETTLDRVTAGDVVDGLPVREFRSFTGRDGHRIVMAGVPVTGSAPGGNISRVRTRVLPSARERVSSRLARGAG